jgi:hypothetical protein
MSKYERVHWLDGHLQDVIEDIDARLAVLERKQEAPAPRSGTFFYNKPIEEASTESLQNALTHNTLPLDSIPIFEELSRRNNLTPAPEHTSEGLYVRVKSIHDSWGYLYPNATPAQVRAEAVRLGLLDTPRQKVAEAFLHAALLDAMDNEDEDYTGIIAGLRYLINTTNKWWIEGMIAVLEQAAKEVGK